MKKPKKFHLETRLCDLIDDLSEHYQISKSDLVEELIHAALFPIGFTSLSFLRNDDYFKEKIFEYSPK